MIKKITTSISAALIMLMAQPQLAAFAGNATATFYSDFFIGRKTASGARFNQGSMTAAHRTLPLGARIRVTNRKNGKSVVVVVNDRCKCSLDLSKAAFSRIAPLHKGRVSVAYKRLW